MKTYTIVYDGNANLLAACEPDDDRDALWLETAQYSANSTPGHKPKMVVTTGCILTDEMPEDDSKIVWQGGWVSDEAGETFDYAVKG